MNHLLILNQSNTKYIFLKDPHLCNKVDKQYTLKNLCSNDDGIEGKIELIGHNNFLSRDFSSEDRMLRCLKEYIHFSIASKDPYQGMICRKQSSRNISC